MTSPQPAVSDAKRFFDENGYHLAKNVLSAAEVTALEQDFDRVVTPLQGSNENVNARWEAKYPLENATVLEAGPGDVLFFHYCLLHGSNRNVSDKIRKTVLVQMHAGHDAVEEGNKHPNAKLALRGWNYAATRSGELTN